MTKFVFQKERLDGYIGNLRVSSQVHHKLKSIAKKKKVPITEVIRVFIDVALVEFEKEYPEHFFNDKSIKEL